jgi:hypothetical protein
LGLNCQLILIHHNKALKRQYRVLSPIEFLLLPNKSLIFSNLT